MPSRYKRKSGIKEPRKIYICCEDYKMEIDYYSQFLSHQNITEAEVEIIHKPDGYSKPSDVLEAVNHKIAELQKQNLLIGIEEYWLCMDVDSWGPLLEKVVEDCSMAERFYPVVSNPCFEVWYLAHHFTCGQIQNMQNELHGKESINLQLASKRLSGNLARDFFPFTKDAVITSRALDIEPNDDIPQTIGTRVYRLIKEILDVNRG